MKYMGETSLSIVKRYPPSIITQNIVSGIKEYI